jgi:hypothetical protein
MADLEWRHLRGGDEGAIWVLATSDEIETYKAASPFNCIHQDSEIRDQVTSNGGIQRKKQCLQCGLAQSQALKIERTASVPPWDNGLWSTWEQACNKRRTEIEDNLISRQENFEYEGYTLYSEYLKSEEWKSQRRLVMNRDGDLCQACLEKPAEEIHHLTYDHIFDEFLFELIAVCRPCHERLHKKKIVAAEAMRAKGLGQV